jgi:epoxide hydrolase
VNTQPFTVDIPQTTLDDPLQQLADIRGPEELDGSSLGGRHEPWSLRELVGWWQTGFDWRPEAAINRFAHNRATVDGVRLHSCTSAAGPGTTRIGPVRAEAAQQSFQSTA